MKDVPFFWPRKPAFFHNTTSGPVWRQRDHLLWRRWFEETFSGGYYAPVTRHEEWPRVLNVLRTFGPDTLFVGGGDGTIHHLLQLELPRDCPVAMVPLGTANVLSYHLVGKKNLSCYTPEDRFFPVSIRLGHSSGCYFVLMAGVGFDGRAAQKVNLCTKKVLGSFAYPLAALSTLVSGIGKPLALEIRRKKAIFETIITHWAVLRRFPFYYPPFPAEARPEILENAFQLDIFTGKNRRDLCLFFLGAALGRTGKFWQRESFQSEEVRVLEEAPGQTDGEDTPFRKDRLTVSSRSITFLFTEKGLQCCGMTGSGKRTDR